MKTPRDVERLRSRSSWLAHLSSALTGASIAVAAYAPDSHHLLLVAGLLLLAAMFGVLSAIVLDTANHASQELRLVQKEERCETED